jgi:hypothetical protein
MYLKIRMLRDKIAHDQRWAVEFFRSALHAEERHLTHGSCGNSYLATCLGNARDAHLESAAFYEKSAVQAEQELALLEKS